MTDEFSEIEWAVLKKAVALAQEKNSNGAKLFATWTMLDFDDGSTWWEIYALYLVDQGDSFDRERWPYRGCEGIYSQLYSIEKNHYAELAIAIFDSGLYDPDPERDLAYRKSIWIARELGVPMLMEPKGKNILHWWEHPDAPC